VDLVHGRNIALPQRGSGTILRSRHLYEEQRSWSECPDYPATERSDRPGFGTLEDVALRRIWPSLGPGRIRTLNSWYREFGGIEELAASRIWWRRGKNARKFFEDIEKLAASRIWCQREIGGGEDLEAVRNWPRRGFGGVQDLEISRMWRNRIFRGIVELTVARTW